MFNHVKMSKKGFIMPQRQKQFRVHFKKTLFGSKNKVSIGLKKDKSPSIVTRTKKTISPLDKSVIREPEVIPSLSLREKQLGETAIGFFLFVEDPNKQTPFEGHDMVQRFLCSLYQISYPYRNDPQYTLGTVDGKLDAKNQGSFVHDLANKLVYDHPMGLHAGLENFIILITKGILIVANNPKDFHLEESYKKFPKDILAEYIASKFLQIAAEYKQDVLQVLSNVVQGSRTFDEVGFFVKKSSSNKDIDPNISDPKVHNTL